MPTLIHIVGSHHENSVGGRRLQDSKKILEEILLNISSSVLHITSLSQSFHVVSCGISDGTAEGQCMAIEIA